MSHRVPVARSGMSLMEVIVALGLSVALMALIGSSLQFYAVTLNQRDEQVRRATIARGVMAMISADLRSCVWSEPQDLSVVSEMLSSGNSSEALASMAGATGGTTGTSEESTGDDASMGTEEDSAAIDLLSYSATERPGLIGTSTQLQFDISRLPRVDQMIQSLNVAPTILQDIPSDLKTVSYHIQSGGSGGVPPPLAAAGALAEPGLVRRVLDREATRYANEMGDVTRLMQTGSLIAPEVVGLEFSYWDGTMWQMSWHSDDMGQLPLAIKVRIQLQPRNSDANSATTSVAVASDIYETIIRLPMATSVIPEPSTVTDLTDDATDSSGGSSSSGSTTGGAASGGTSR